MKRYVLLIAGLTLLATVTTAAAFPAERTFGLKAGAIGFTEGAAASLDLERGSYLGAEVYGRIAERLSLGGEIGYSRLEGSIPLVENELTYIPVELNLKYSGEIRSELDYFLGAGLSYSFVELEQDCQGTCFAEDEDWVAGAQLFGGVELRLRKWLFDLEGKYQLSEKDLDNWRMTGKAGFVF